MTGFVRSQYANIGAVGTAAVMALTVVSVPPSHGGSLQARPEIVAVQLQAAIATGVAALVNSAPQAAAVGIGPAATPVTSSDEAVTAPAEPTASAATVDDIQTSMGRVALNIAGTVLSPIWYLAFPLTMGLGPLWGYVKPYPVDPSGAVLFLMSTLNFFKWLSFPFRLGDVVLPPDTPAAAATRSAATEHSIHPEVVSATGLPAASDPVDVPAPSTQSMSAATALAAPNAAATSIDDVLNSIGRVAFNVVGTLLSPIWYLAAPITTQLGSLWGYVEPIVLDPLLGLTFAMQMTNLMRWLYFPSRLGDFLLPQTAPAAAATRPAATALPVNPDAQVPTAPAASDPATVAKATKPGTSQPTRQRSTTAAHSAAVETAPSGPDASTAFTTATPDTTTASDEQVVPTRSDLVSEVATASAKSGPQGSPAPSAVSQSGPRKSIANTPSGQRGDNSASTRTSRAVSSYSVR